MRQCVLNGRFKYGDDQVDVFGVEVSVPFSKSFLHLVNVTNLDSEISLGLPFLAGPSPIEGMDVHSVMGCHLVYRSSPFVD